MHACFRFQKALHFLSFLFMIVCLLPSCVSVGFEIPNNRFIIPENSGDQFSGRVGVGYGSNTYVSLIHNSFAEDVDVENPKLRKKDGFYGNTEMSIIPEINVIFGPTGFGLKGQVWGAPEKSAEPGNISVAFAFAGMSGEVRSRDFIELPLGFTVHTHTKVNYELFDSMALLGYRLTEQQLIYLNFSHLRFFAKGHMTQTISKTSDNKTTETRGYDVPSGTGNELSSLVGYQLSFTNYYFLVEPGYAVTHWTNAKSLGRFVLGMALGVKW